MRDKIDEFSEFYKELNQNVSDLRHKLLILCKSEQIERERLEAAKKGSSQFECFKIFVDFFNPLFMRNYIDCFKPIRAKFKTCSID